MKLKRKISLVLLCAFAVILVACGRESGNDEEALARVPLIESSPDIPSAPSPDGMTDTCNNTASTSGIEMQGTENDAQTAEIPTQEKLVDPYGCLVLDRTECQNQGGAYIQRDGKNYKLGGWVSLDHSIKYGIGTRPNPTMKIAALYIRCGDFSIVSMGNVPVMTLEKDDQVVCYNTDIIILSRVTSSSASLRATSERSQWTIWPATGSEEYAEFSSGAKQLQIEDQSGRVLPEFTPNDLELGKQYTISWFEYGTTYREFRSVADSTCYRMSRDDPNYMRYEIEGTLTKNGYAEFDLSEVEPGLYCFDKGFDPSTGGLINIE